MSRGSVVLPASLTASFSVVTRKLAPVRSAARRMRATWRSRYRWWSRSSIRSSGESDISASVAANCFGSATPHTERNRRPARASTSTGEPDSSRSPAPRKRAWKIGAAGCVRAIAASASASGEPRSTRVKTIASARRIAVERLAQASPRRRAPAAEGVAGVEEEQVDVARDGEVLESVVEDEEVGSEIRRAPRRLDAPLADDDDDAGGRAGEGDGLVASALGADERPIARRDDEDAS